MVGKWGAGAFYMPHMITADNNGDVWTTDVGAHVATKWSPSGEKLLELGTWLEPGHDEKHFCKPTQVHQLCQAPIVVIDRLAFACICSSRENDHDETHFRSGYYPREKTSGIFISMLVIVMSTLLMCSFSDVICGGCAGGGGE